MGKTVFIAEKPSVARQFCDALKIKAKSKDGYLEGENTIITWCVGHLITMSYPEVYDEKYKKWSFATLPFLPDEYKYEVIPSAKKQFATVKELLTRDDVDTIYVCTDSGREGEYIYRLVDAAANVKGKVKKRVWIDSQTEEEIRRGIREAKDLSYYDPLASSAYLRAKEDYLMGINFSRALSLKYGNTIANFLNMKYAVISVGRVMTCVLGMVVKREREIRDFKKTPFYRLIASFSIDEKTSYDAEFKALEGSAYYMNPLLYKENGFKDRAEAEKLADRLTAESQGEGIIEKIEKKKEVKKPPLLFNLAELQNLCSKLFKISPEETLKIIQELYEKKLVTYPRTDARVLSTAIAKEIHKNIAGLKRYDIVGNIPEEILKKGSYKGLEKTKYVNDKQITDHYAIIPTGQGIEGLSKLAPLSQKVYEVIVRRFLAIFLDPAEYQKTSIVTRVCDECFYASFKLLSKEGFLSVNTYSFSKAARSGQADDKESAVKEETGDGTSDNPSGEEEDVKCDPAFLEKINAIRKGAKIRLDGINIKEGETSPPKRYTGGSIILAMENAGQLIEDEELRAQIKGSGIGTSATRAGILEKLFKNKYLKLNKKTQTITPELFGEMIYDVVAASIKPLLDPTLTASWEKGLTQVAEGTISPDVYMDKLNDYVARRTNQVKNLNNQSALRNCYINASRFYKKGG
ncbi:MAG: type IA DNA topoisomerase [Lachnospiraceae bacterium]|nr:type IA DNA topoisomerase [Lachnospiraceae bacterium]